ncbi:MAG: hypothetical protein LBR09_03010 [Endomicrobium sp.]|nr:hypothetical protein [Endomicrobium sp.]
MKDYQEKLQKQLMRRLNKKEAHLLGRYREKEEQWELICYFYVLSEIDFQEEKRRFLKENKTKK